MKYKLFLLIFILSFSMVFSAQYIRFGYPVNEDSEFIRFGYPYQTYASTSPPPTTVNTALGSATDWSWASSEGEGSVKSGNAYDWTWRAYEASSGRKVPNGTAYLWTWVNE